MLIEMIVARVSRALAIELIQLVIITPTILIIIAIIIRARIEGLLEVVAQSQNNVIIMQAVQRGRHGASVIMADVGSKQRCQEDGISQPPPHRIPIEALPTTMPGQLRKKLRRCHVPDGMLYRPGSQSKRAKYTVIEIKYCRDSDPHPQLKRATQQHKQLMRLIRKYDGAAGVNLATIVLGVSGGIYLENTVKTLESLGISKAKLPAVIRKLHTHAVKSLTSILRYKRWKEWKARKRKKPQ